jgi:hypothetical protein
LESPRVFISSSIVNDSFVGYIHQGLELFSRHGLDHSMPFCF